MLSAQYIAIWVLPATSLQSPNRVRVFSVLHNAFARFPLLSLVLRLSSFFALPFIFTRSLPEPLWISPKSGRMFSLTSPSFGVSPAVCCAVLCFLLTPGVQSGSTNLPQPASEMFDSWMCWRHRKLCSQKMWICSFPVNHSNWRVLPLLISGHGSRKRNEQSVFSSILCPLYKKKNKYRACSYWKLNSSMFLLTTFY